jgi:O-antigen ligase
MSGSSLPQKIKAGGRVRTRFPVIPLLLVLGALLANYITLKAVSMFGSVMLFAPALALALAWAALCLLNDPVQVLCWFLIIVVNLDFFRIRHTALTADILTSSLLLYAVMVRLGLSGGFALRGKVEKMYLAYIAITFISVVLSVDVPLSIKNWGRDLEYLFLFIFLSTLPITENDRLRITTAISLSSIIPCFLGLIGMVFGIEAFYGQTTPVAGGPAVHRIVGTLSHPVVFAVYLALVATITLGLILTQKQSRTLLVPVFILQLIVLYLTYGRTGWFQFLVSLAVLLWILGRRKILFLGLPMLVVGLVTTLPTLLARLQNAFQPENSSLIWRFGLWIYALKRFPERPIFGSGQDTFLSYIHYGKGFDPHHTWIGLLIETGIVGTLAFLLLVIVVGRELRRKRQEPDAKHDYLVPGVSAVFVGIIVSSLAGDTFDLPVVVLYFWVLLALALKPRPVPHVAT